MPAPTLPGPEERTTWIQRVYARSEWHTHRGIRVTAAIFRDKSRALALTRMFAALDVIHEVSPRQVERVPLFLHSLAVVPVVNALAVWRRDLHAAFFDRHFVLAAGTTPQLLAVTIIHELTHARLERAGFQYTEDRRARCERICCLAERNFIARLPDSDERKRLERRNRRYLAIPPTHWSDAQFAKRLAEWRASQPLWHQITYTVVDFIYQAHRAALANDR